MICAISEFDSSSLMCVLFFSIFKTNILAKDTFDLFQKNSSSHIAQLRRGVYLSVSANVSEHAQKLKLMICLIRSIDSSVSEPVVVQVHATTTRMCFSPSRSVSDRA